MSNGKGPMSLAGKVLMFSLLCLALTAAALGVGLYAVFSGVFIGFRGLGLPARTGAEAVRIGYIFIPFGVVFAIPTFLGLRYSLPKLRKESEALPPRPAFDWSLRPRRKERAGSDDDSESSKGEGA
jgi:hypothetical protein